MKHGFARGVKASCKEQRQAIAELTARIRALEPRP
jgi:hypothetical protein